MRRIPAKCIALHLPANIQSFLPLIRDLFQLKNISTGEQLVQLIFMLIYFLLWKLQSNSIAAAAHSLEATKRHSWKQAQKVFCPQILYSTLQCGGPSLVWARIMCPFREAVLLLLFDWVQILQKSKSLICSKKFRPRVQLNSKNFQKKMGSESITCTSKIREGRYSTTVASFIQVCVHGFSWHLQDQ